MLKCDDGYLLYRIRESDVKQVSYKKKKYNWIIIRPGDLISSHAID